MTEKQNCQQISSAISIIKSKRDEFDIAQSGGDVKAAAKLMSEIKAIDKRVREQLWTLEILTKENIGKQYGKWCEMYQDLNTEFKLPKKERILEFLSKDRSFMELMETKEKQGLTKLIVAPAPGFYSLDNAGYFVGKKVQECGGGDNHYHGVWLRMSGRENDIRYFGKIKPEEIVPSDGITAGEIKGNPDRYSICDGWMISFTTEEQNVAKYIAKVIGGRKAIVTNQNAAEFQETYFSNSDPMYEGEEAMIPQEHLAIFAKDFFEKYVKVNRRVSAKSEDLIDNAGVVWFISTYLADGNSLPAARWSSALRYYGCSSSNSKGISKDIGVRSVVRRNIKSKF